MTTAPVFQCDHRVTYAECTVGNHVYHSRYLDILEVARSEFFRTLRISFLDWQARDTLFPVIGCHLRFKKPARYDDVLNIKLCVTQVEGVRMNFAYRIHSGQHLLVEAATQHVCTSLQDKPKRVPEELAMALKPFVHEFLESP